MDYLIDKRKFTQETIEKFTLGSSFNSTNIQKKLLDFDKKLFERAEQLISLKTKKEL